MTPEEFSLIIVPLLLRFDSFGPETNLPMHDLELLWLASTPYVRSCAPRRRAEARGARDLLVDRWPDGAAHICRQLRTNYGALKQAEAAGIENVRVVVQPGCGCFGAVLNGLELSVQLAISAFMGDCTVPLLPPTEAQCARFKNAPICSVRAVAIRDGERHGRSPELPDRRTVKLDLTATGLPKNWAELIVNSPPSGRKNCPNCRHG